MPVYGKNKKRNITQYDWMLKLDGKCFVENSSIK